MAKNGEHNMVLSNNSAYNEFGSGGIIIDVYATHSQIIIKNVDLVENEGFITSEIYFYNSIPLVSHIIVYTELNYHTHRNTVIKCSEYHGLLH